MTKKLLIPASAFFCILMAVGCMTMPTPEPQPTKTDNTISHQYGEEILAYMMQVVLGQAGDPDRRVAWQNRGLDQSLDLAQITSIMSDPDGNKSSLMVQDPNILGLSKVLYHYAPEMSQFSGSYSTSLYPATELVALRLLMLRLLRKNRRLSIQSLLDHRQLLTDSRQEPSRSQLAALNLTHTEARLLQAAFSSKPWLFDSLTNPFLVAAFYRIGLLKKDPLTRNLIAKANYRYMACKALDSRPGKDAVTVAFLPSITREFMPNDDGFSPSPVYLAAIESLKNGIMQAYRNAAVQSEDEDESGPARDGLLSETVSFQAVENRPMVIYPENAASVIQETCPAADFIVIILGRNVYQSMHIDPAADTYPAVNRLYLDITDIKHGQAASEIKEIGEFLYKKLKPRLAAVLPERTAS